MHVPRNICIACAPQLMRRLGLDMTASGGVVGGGDAAQTSFTTAQPHRPLSAGVAEGLAAAARGAILPLRVLTLDVLHAPRDGLPRAPVAASDPVIAIACELRCESFGAGVDHASSTPGSITGPAGGQSEPRSDAHGTTNEHTREAEELDGEAPDDAGAENGDEDETGAAMLLPNTEGGGLAGVAAGQSVPASHSAGHHAQSERVMFLLVGPGQSGLPADGGNLAAGQGLRMDGGVRVVCCGSEAHLLATWRDWLLARDPDALATFQVSGC
jgi:hypothetical protein